MTPIPTDIRTLLDRLKTDAGTERDLKALRARLHDAILDGTVSADDADTELNLLQPHRHRLPNDPFKATRIAYRERKVETTPHKKTVFHIQGMTERDAERLVADAGWRLDPLNGTATVENRLRPRTAHQEISMSDASLYAMLRNNTLETYELVSFGYLSFFDVFRNVKQLIHVCHPSEALVLRDGDGKRPTHYFAPSYVGFIHPAPLPAMLYGFLEDDPSYRRASRDGQYTLLGEVCSAVPFRVVPQEDGTRRILRFDDVRLQAITRHGVRITSQLIDNLYSYIETLPDDAAFADWLART